MNGHKAKQIRREALERNPNGFDKPYCVEKQRISSKRQAKKAIVRERS